MRQVIAIGGGGFGRTQASNLIEQYILDQASKDKPNICFIPTATGDADPYIVNYYSVFTKLNCSPTHLSFFKRTLDLKDHILNQDIIFVGGGNTKSMLAVWKEWGLDTILKQAYENGTVMSGVSAGAICWFQNGLTDSWASELKLMQCMNFISGSCAPHYDEEPERRPATKELLKNKNIDFMYGIEGGAALHFINEIPERTVRFKKNKQAYNVTIEKDKQIEIPYTYIDLNK